VASPLHWCDVTDLSQLGISGRVRNLLEHNGIADVEALLAKNARELLGFERFGAGSLGQVLEALKDAGVGDLAVDPYAPYVCARESREAGDTGLSNLFLCDDCAALWESAAFAGEPPQYVGEAVWGFCLNCNRKRSDVRLRQWFLCGNCDRVARSIGRSVVAERFVEQEWDRLVARHAPHLKLRTTDEPTLRHWDRTASTDRRAEIDFVIRDEQRGQDRFGFEMKTGKAYLSGGQRVGSRMQSFQLDTSDCDAIATVTEREDIPVYLLHVQVIDRAHAPTLEYRPLGVWWTDPFRMKDSLTVVKQRPRESRMAAYYRTTMFERLDTFAEHVRSGGPERLRERLTREGMPALYALNST
jgi:hypothetical protein